MTPERKAEIKAEGHKSPSEIEREAVFAGLDILLLRFALRYEPETGDLIWLPGSGRNFSGQRAGHVDRFGYKRFRFNKKPYSNHRVAWALHYGEWPLDQIDHINRDKGDNRIGNLRAATQFENARNVPPKRLSSPYKGVTWRPTERRWYAIIRKDGRTIRLGSFSSDKDAALAYDVAARELYGEFAYLNFPATKLFEEE